MSEPTSPSSRPLSGVWVDALTPLTPSLDIDLAQWTSHLRTLATKNAEHFVLFGHAGEGDAFSFDEKISALRGLLKAGFDADAFLLGINTSAVPAAANLIRQAHSLGIRRFLVAPPTHIDPVPQTGMSRFFSQLIQQVDRTEWSLLVHLIGVGDTTHIPDATLADLIRNSPSHVRGLVDQGKSVTRTLDYMKAFGEKVSVVFCMEEHLHTLRPPGIVSIQANLIPRAVEHVLHPHAVQPASRIPGLKEHKFDERVQSLAAIMQGMPRVSGYKFLLSLFYHHPDWQITRPPYSLLDKVKLEQLEKAFKKFEIQPDE